ncbi:MAG TPA: hypothetical protein VMR14_21680 [Streptosporangiaceae bacterium]|nr:hypothetical protein [Streptosporangiaceae bacterium]
MTTSEMQAPRTYPALEPDNGGTRSRLRSRWAAPGAFTGLGLVLFVAYLAEASKLPIFADGSSQALQAWDMLRGNLLLHGWVLSDVSFYTTELPQYMLIELVRGLSPYVVHIAAAMTYALLVVLTAVLAKGKATGREALVRVLIPVGIMLAPPFGRVLFSRGYSTAWILLSAPDHTGTQVPLVLTWLVLDRMRPRWWLPVVVTALLTWVEIADSTAIFEGALPIVVVCAVRMYRRRGGLAAQWHDLGLGVGALASAGAAMVAVAVIQSHGGFAVNPAPTALATIEGMTASFWVKVHSILILFGADFFGLSAANAAIPIAHLVAVALVAWGVTRAVRQFFADDDLARQVVTASFLLLLAEFMFGYRTGAREAVGLLPIGAALAGRTLALRVSQLRLVPALAAMMACYCLSMGYYILAPPLPSPDQPLASWLRAHHLSYGLSASWYSSNGVTLYSQDRVQVRDVRITAGGELTRLRWNTKASWYSARLHDARFVVLNPCATKFPDRLIHTIGPPARTYFAAGFTVLVWDTNLLARHASPAPLLARASAGVPSLPRPPPAFLQSAAYEVMCG